METNYVEKLAPATRTPSSIEQVLVTTLNALNAPPPPPNLNCPAAQHPAIERCLRAYNDAHTAAKTKGKDRFASEEAAKLAFRQAMPPLSGHQNIRDFIACLAHGILVNVIGRSDSSRLLQAAQVAYSARDARPHRKAKPTAKISPKAPLKSPLTAP